MEHSKGAANPTVDVVHFHRKPFPGCFSIEGLFANLRMEMQKQGWHVEHRELPWHSKGLLRRLRSLVWAAKRQGELNHITGDVHYLALALKRDKTILTIHDLQMLERLHGLRRWILKLFWFELPLRRVRLVTVISDYTRQELMKEFPFCQGKVIVVPDAVSARFQPYPQDFDVDRPRILQIGTKANKNLPRLFAALEGLSCYVHIVGKLDIAQRADLERRQVQFTNDAALSEAALYHAYCEADIVSFVSTYEGFGMPILEAQWVERPVVTSNCSSMPEVAGDGACFVDPHDVNSIRQGLKRVIDDAEYRESLIEQGRKNRERFALPKVAARYIQLYQRLAAHNDGSSVERLS